MGVDTTDMFATDDDVIDDTRMYVVCWKRPKYGRRCYNCRGMRTIERVLPHGLQGSVS